MVLPLRIELRTSPLPREMAGSSKPFILLRADAHIHAALGRVPAIGSRAVRGQARVEQGAIALVVHDVAHVTPEVGGEVGVIARSNDVPGRVGAEKPRREAAACQLRLAVARRHEDQEPLDLTTRNGLKLLSHQLVMLSRPIVGKRVPSERDQALLRSSPPQQLPRGLLERWPQAHSL